MNKLTNRQEIFAQAIATGMSQSEAYHLVFPSSNNWKPESVHNKASELAGNGEVLARVENLKEEMAVQSSWKRQEPIARLVAIATDENVRTSDRLAAVHLLNVMHGYYTPTKLDHTPSGDNMTSKPTIDVSKLSENAMAEILAAKVI